MLTENLQYHDNITRKASTGTTHLPTYPVTWYTYLASPGLSSTSYLGEIKDPSGDKEIIQ